MAPRSDSNADYENSSSDSPGNAMPGSAMPSNAMMVRDGGTGAMTSPPPQPEILSVSPRPVDLLHALRRRWGWALGLGLLVTTTAVIVAMLVIPTNYTSSALLRIGAREKIMFDTPGGEGLLANRNSQAVLIKKPFVLDQALNEPGVAQLSCIRDERDKVAWLQKNLQVDFPGRNELMEIKMTGEDPAQLKRLVDAVVDAYMEKVVEVDRNAQLARKRFLQLRYEENLDDIKLKTSQVQQLSKKFHASDSDAIREKQVTALEDFSLLKRRATAARAEVRAMDRKARLLQARLDDLPDQEEPDEDADARRKKEILAAMMEQAFAQDQWLVQSTQQAQLLGVQIEEEKLRAAREDAPSVIRLQEQLETRSEQIEKRREELGPILLPQVEDLLERKIAAGLVDTPLTVPEKISRMIDDLNLEKVLAMEDADQAKEEFDAAAEEAKKIDAYSLELETTREELDRRKKITSRMAALLEEWDVEMNALRQVTVLEPARIPKTSDVDEKTKRVVFIGLAALAVTIFGVAAVDFSSRRINSSAEVAYGLGVRVMGNTPSMTGRAWRRHGAASAFHGMLAESVDNIRTALLHSAKTEGIRAVTVTSSMEKEGKSTLASQLAASLARSGRRTLLIDGDLRRPSIHRLLEAPVDPGLCELLRGEVVLDEIVRPTRMAGLWVVPAGRSDADAIQALTQDGLRDVLATLREEFDFVVVDSGPVLSDAESLMFARHTDAVILSILRDVSRAPRVFETCERLRAMNICVIGAVVNGISASRYRSYYRPYSSQPETSASV